MTFVKGVSGNPAGRPKSETTKNIEILQDLSRTYVECRISNVMQMTVNELIKLAKDPEAQAIDVAIASIMINSVKGDYRALNFLFDRVIGKVVDKVDFKMPEPFIIKSLKGSTTTMGMREIDED